VRAASVLQCVNVAVGQHICLERVLRCVLQFVASVFQCVFVPKHDL